MALRPGVAAMTTAELLIALQQRPEFQAVMGDIWRTQRPGVPPFEPQASMEENYALLERVKFSYGMQKGFDLLFSVLTGQ